ncbi:hypothetical protein HA402_015861 [Bradysia odoriphaga]|nr:hypothetical protein HA402_015861 [Bradysia odoriphaga]
MKGLYFIVGFLLVYQSHAGLLSSEKCITLTQLLTGTAMACQDKNNTMLWQKIVDCHDQINEQFLRMSPVARCPKNKHVENTLDRSFSISDVFLNVCDLIEGSAQDKSEGFSCIDKGTITAPFLMTHDIEAKLTKILFGKNVLCDIGTCIKDVFNF